MIGILLGFIVTLSSVKILKPVAERLALVDLPGGRKKHAENKPLIGGVAMFIGFAAAMLSLPISLIGYRPFAAAAFLLVLVGILDDMHELSARARFIAEIIAGLILTLWAGIILRDLGNLFSKEAIVLGWFAIPFTIFAVVGLINAVNMLDGSDGLAASLTFVQLLFLCLAAIHAHYNIDARVLLLLASTVAGFLFFNFPWGKKGSASIFMGDAGSMFLGFALSWFAISLSQPGHQALYPISVAWILGITLWDAVRVIVIRLFKGVSPLKPDRKHWHHVLEEAGYSASARCMITIGISIALAMIGLFASVFSWNQSLMLFLYLFGFVVYGVVLHRASLQVR